MTFKQIKRKFETRSEVTVLEFANPIIPNSPLSPFAKNVTNTVTEQFTTFVT